MVCAVVLCAAVGRFSGLLVMLYSGYVYAGCMSDKLVKIVHVNISYGLYFNTNEDMQDLDECGGTVW